MNNRFQLLTCLQFNDGTHETLLPYEFILKSGRTNQKRKLENYDNLDVHREGWEGGEGGEVLVSLFAAVTLNLLL